MSEHEPDDIRAIHCPSCGAPVEMTEDQMICPYCGTMLERPRPRERVVERIVTRLPQPIQTPAQSGSATGAFVGMAIIVVVLISIIAGLIIFLDEGGIGLPLNPDRVHDWTPTLVSADDDPASSLLLLTRSPSADEYSLTLLDVGTRAVRWRKTLDKDAYQATVVAHGDGVYVALQTRLLALGLAEGQTAWEGALADVLAGSQGDCLQVFDDRVVALTKDGTVQAFDVRTGKPAWSVRLGETPRRLWSVAGQPAVLDQKEGDSGAHLLILNPVDGTVAHEVMLDCRVEGHPWDQTASVHSPAQVDSARGLVYVLLGYDPMCVQCVSGATGDLVWTATVADVHYAWVDGVVLAGDALYVTNHVDNGVLDVVDVTKGTARRLTNEKDYDLTVLAAQSGGTVVVHAVRTRGSEQHELWGLDPSTGERRWQYVVQGLDAFGDNWVAQVTSQGLTVLRVPDDEAKLYVDVLGLDDAQVLHSNVVELGYDDLGAVAWTNTHAYVTSWGKLYAVDLTTGELDFAWP